MTEFFILMTLRNAQDAKRMHQWRAAGSAYQVQLKGTQTHGTRRGGAELVCSHATAKGVLSTMLTISQ